VLISRRLIVRSWVFDRFFFRVPKQLILKIGSRVDEIMAFDKWILN
jgi:hypothetical protein